MEVPPASVEPSFTVEVEKFTLDNGLTVLMHKDTSDPVVAVVLTTHVGSAREKEGRTGFAHLFEHLLFLDSENLGKGGLDKMSARIGGSGANGSTNRDRTNYFQTVPKDALEKMIWAEADKLGYFINTVTQPVLEKEKQVVKNEKRQGVDNQPYGHEDYVIGKNLYATTHPYNWQVIGSLQDLQNATLDDVKQFYNTWYTPNNTVLSIAGDFDAQQAREWVEKYFGEIPAGPQIPLMEEQPASLDKEKRLYYEDNFARLPQLSLTWPGVPVYDKDAYALDVLTRYLDGSKDAPLNAILIDSLQYTDRVSISSSNSEVAGEIQLTVRAFKDQNLQEVLDGIELAFQNYENNGMTQADLDRIKAQQETRFYNSLSSVLGKGIQLAQYEIFAGDASYINKDLQLLQAVTLDDVQSAYRRYIKDQPFLATSFVPKGQQELALPRSRPAQVVEEKIVAGNEPTVNPNVVATHEPTPSSFDRSAEPDYGAEIELNTPDIWQQKLSSGMQVFGISSNEVPLASFTIELQGGQLLEEQDKSGLVNVLAQMLMRGTENRTTAQLENAIDDLGATLYIRAGKENLSINGTVLTRNYDALMSIVEEILLEPRWDQQEFQLIKKSVQSSLQQQKASANAIASLEFDKILYGENHLLARNFYGTPATVEDMTIQDLQSYYDQFIASNYASYRFVGDQSQSEVLAVVNRLNNQWKTTELIKPSINKIPAVLENRIYFYDVPGAKQSVLRVGHPSISKTHPDFDKLDIANYRLGGGGFASQLTQELREGKGYTYGIRSGFDGSRTHGEFSISSGVRSNVTKESVALIDKILNDYGTNYSKEDLEVTKSFLLKSSARAFETAGAKLYLLQEIELYDRPTDFKVQEQQEIKNITLQEVKNLIDTYIQPRAMYYLVVGDKATQLEPLKQLELGPVIEIN
jgi:zinc protease